MSSKTTNSAGTQEELCYSPGVPEIDIQDGIVHVFIESVQGQDILPLPGNLPDMYINIYFKSPFSPNIYDLSTLPLVSSTELVNPVFIESDQVGCGGTNRRLYTYKHQIDIDSLKASLSTYCDEDEDQIYVDQIVIVLATYDTDGFVIHYPFNDYPNVFNCAHPIDAISATLVHNITSCCGNPNEWEVGHNLDILDILPTIDPKGDSEGGPKGKGRSRTDYHSNEITISPNPVKSHLDIKSAKGIREIILSDFSGHIIQRQKYVNRISLENLDSGIYIINIFDGYNWTAKRVVKL